jgi:hypothetical protein
LKQAIGHSERDVPLGLTISGWLRLDYSSRHAIASGWTRLAPASVLVEILSQRFLNLRQSVFADLVRFHRPLHLRDKLVDVRLLLS